MRNNRKLRPVTLLTILTGTIVATLLLAHFLNPEPTQAKSSGDNATQSADPKTVGQTADQTLANCRYGLTTGPGTSQILTELGAGIFYRWEADWPYPLPENDAELMRMIRPRQRKTSSGEYLPDYYTNYPLNEELADIIRGDPGAVWMIGNEIERGPNPGQKWTANTDDIHADIYAEAYHDIYHFIKGIDRTARIANAGLIQITPMRLQYLDMMWDAYLEKYEVPMPVDVWTIHTYVLPELTPDGQPNNIASAALGTDLALGKRLSGGDAAKCPDPDVYCYAEHDDPTILEDQVLAMRQWMKARGQQEKPLVVTEFSTLYHYIVKEDGRCGGLFDEFGKCLTPERVSKFMTAAFDYFNNARDAELGMPADDNKLVQQWIWYGAYNWNIGTSNLLQNDYRTLTLMGETFQEYVFSEATSVNLVVDSAAGTVVAEDESGTATAQLSVSFRNNGNVSIKEPFTVTFYQDAALTQAIDSTRVTPIIRGCATGQYSAKIEWEGLSTGSYQFWASVDSNNEISETDEADNIGSGQITVSGPAYSLDVQTVSDGQGTGGTVSASPEGPIYPEGTIVSLTAIPYSGWSFTGWKGAIIGNAPRATVSMTSDLSVVANFIQNQYALNVKQIGEGEVIVSPKKDHYLYGNWVTLLAVPAPGWRFVEWRGDVADKTPTIGHSFKGDLNIQAVFEELVPNASHSVFNPVIAGGS